MMPNARSAMESSVGERISRDMELLVDDDDVAGLHDGVGVFLAVDRVVVFDSDDLGLPVDGAVDSNRTLVGEVGKALRAREHVGHRGSALDFILAGHLVVAMLRDYDAV